MQKLWYILVCLPFVAQAQLPTTHLYAFEWSLDSNMVKAPKMLSSSHLSGYNNQPSFIDLDEIIYVSNMRDTGQTDLYQMHLTNGSIKPITQTSTSEYSPSQNEDGSWRCVRVDSNENQFLWQFPWDGLSQGESIWSNNKVGYYKDLGLDSFVVFLTGQPNQLAVVNSYKNKAYRFTSKIGRTFHEFDGQIYYLHKLTKDSWYIKRYDPELKKSTIVTRAMDNIEDFHINRQGELWCAKGTKLYSYESSSVNKWKEFLDLSDYGLHQITRMIDNEKFFICVDLLPDYEKKVLAKRQEKINGLISGEKAPLQKNEIKDLSHFSIKKDYRVLANLTVADQEKYYNIPTYSGKEKIFKKFGTIKFTLEGDQHELTLFQNQKLRLMPQYKDHLFLPFNDLSNGSSTYGGGRYIDLKISDIKEGKIWVDFNLCYNPWCAYSDGFNCPVPPPENNLTISIPVGEKNYDSH